VREVIGAPCPKCAKLAPLSLAHPDTLVCKSCGFTGAPTSDTVRELHEASSALGLIDARHRQLTESQRRSIQKATVHMVVAIFFVVFFVLVVVELYRRPLPAIAAAVLGAGIVAIVVFRGRALRVALAASFGATRCRVCGEPVTGDQLIARCHHCAADNLLDRSLAPTDAGSLVDRVTRAASRPGR
jgi:hypothetical protein